MKKLIALLILTVPMIIYGQDSGLEQSRFSIGLNFSPNYSYRTLKGTDEFQFILDLRNEIEEPSFGFNTGLAAHYLVTERVEAVLGVQFSRYSYILRNLPFTSETEPNSSRVVDLQNKFHYLEIPLRINYRYINKKAFSYVSLGVSANQLLNAKNRAHIKDENGDSEVVNSETDITNFNKTVVGIIGGVGFGYHLNEKLDLRIEPLFRYSLTPLADAVFDQFNYSIGCQAEMNLKF